MHSNSRLALTLTVTAAVGLSWAQNSPADVLELKNRTILNGKFAGGTPGTVRFETKNGVEVFAAVDVATLSFTSAAIAAVPSAPAPTPAASGSITAPAGTTLLVRMSEPVSSMNAAGAIFSARLEHDLAVGEARVVPAGATVFGKVQSASQARRVVGRSTLDIRLYQISVEGKVLPIATTPYRVATADSLQKVARTTAVGAAIGEIADNDAGKGAAIGAGAAALRPGQAIVIPAGKLLEFDLIQPLTVNAR